MSKSKSYVFGVTTALVVVNAAIYAVLAYRKKKKEEQE